MGDRDWLVTGVSQQQLLDLGYQQVGRDFPVFLHPQTREEHALPRCSTDGLAERQQVEADLCLRDLTINAMAIGADEELIDPLNGQEDLQRRLLRHTPAFADDPIRVLRLARFSTRYAAFGFRPAGETVALVKTLVADGVLENLVAERVWSEIVGALQESRPAIFFQILRVCDALSSILPEVDQLFGVPQPEKHHPEIDSGIHSLLVLEQACRLSDEPEVRFAALVHDLGKGTTPADLLPRHHGHEERGERLIAALGKRLKIPNRFSTLARLAAKYHTQCHKVTELKPRTVLKMLTALDCLRRPQQLESFLITCMADTRGRRGFEEKSYPQANIMRAARDAAAKVDSAAIALGANDPAKIAELIAKERTKAIALKLRDM